jgi:hypothetical protein
VSRARTVTALLLVALAQSGCGSQTATTDALSPEAAGTVEIRIDGASGRVELYVDGSRVRSQDERAAWKTARTSFMLRPGDHSVEARIRVVDAEGDERWLRITTPRPIAVRAGARTRLVADLRGRLVMPSDTQFHFRVEAQDEPPTPAAARGPSTGDVPIDVPYAWHSPARTATEDLGPAVPLVAGPEPAAPRPASAGLTIEVLVTSEPDSVLLSLGEETLGRTPLRIQVDPRQDFVLRAERDGCDPAVRVVAAEEWRAGRSPVVRLRLDCR